MQNQGDAFYPTGFAESLEDNKPSGWSMGLLANPMAAVASTVGKTFYNQHKYGMNKDAAVAIFLALSTLMKVRLSKN